MLRILIVAAAAWVSGGAMAGTAQAIRVGVTPSLWWLVAALAAAGAARRLFLPIVAAILLLPWLPVRVPAAFLVWTGPPARWLWLLIAAGVAIDWLHRTPPARLASMASDPRRAPRLAAAAAAVLFLAAAYRVSPRLPAGDEPHYLVITQSLLTDHDLRIENNYQRGDYRAYYLDDLRPDYLQRGRDGQIYPIHAPGLPAAVAPAFALFGYPGVVVFLALLNAAATALAWTAAWRMTGSAAAAWFGWAAVALSEPFFVQAFMVYPDAPAGAIVMLAVSTLLLGRDASSRRLAATGLALALLPWLHSRVAVLAAALAIVLAARQRGEGWWRRVAALAAAPIVSAAAWFAFFYVVYGTPDPRAPYAGAQQMALASLPRGIVGLLFDQQFGMLPNAPVYLCAALGFVRLGRLAPRIAIELGVALIPYAIAVAAFPMWWAGYTTPARFLVPTLLPLAIPAAMWFQATRRAARIANLGALALSLLITMTIGFVGRGALLLNFRDGTSRLLAWLSPTVDLAKGAPSLFQNEPGTVVLQALVWLASAGAIAVVALVLSRRGVRADRAAVACGLSAATAAMLALTVVWRTNRAEPVRRTSGAVAVLHALDADSRQVKLQLPPFRPVRAADLLAQMPIVDEAPAKGEPLVNVSHAPAATYSIELTLAHPASGRVTATLDRSMGAAWSFNVDAAGVWRRDVEVPVASPVLIVDADPVLRTAVDRVTVRALAVAASSRRVVDDEARDAARYGSAFVFVIGGDADMEPAGIWIRGGSSADLVIVADDRSAVRMLVRTPPVTNHVALDGDGWHQEIMLAPAESKIVDVPSGRVRITADRGARPIDFEPGSRDERVLGCWIEFR